MTSNTSLITNLISSTNKDLVTKNLDLTRAVIELVNGNGTATLAKAGVEIIQWLARERIDKSDYLYFIERTSGIAYPNEQGLEIREHILRSEAKLSRLSKLGGLQLKRNGSLGRWVAFSDEHLWLVTTVASMSAFYDLEGTALILVKMSLQAHQRHPAHKLQWQRLKAILGKVCQSIALHVINPGHSVGALPSELAQLCAHLCDELTLAEILSKIFRSERDILIYSGRFPAAIVSWLLVHFGGTVQVSVGGSKIYTKSGENSSRSVTVLVKNRCLPGTDCKAPKEEIRVSERHDYDWKRIVFGLHDPNKHPRSSLKHSLYQTDGYPRFRILNFQARNKIAQTAKDLVSWLLNLRLDNQRTHVYGFFFAFYCVDLPKSQHGGATGIPLGSLLHRWPDKAYANSKADDSVVDASRLDRSRGSIPNKSFPAAFDDIMSVNEIADMFPLVKDMLNHHSIRDECTCPDCGANNVIDRYRPGCMREAAISCLFLLVGHAIADGFGVDEASGMIDLDDYACEVRKLLSQLRHSSILWNTWFNLAASTALGYSPSRFVDPVNLDKNGEEGIALVAVQYGSSIAAAPWTDISKELVLEGCFHVQTATGVINEIQDDFGLVVTEMTLDIDSVEPLPLTPADSDGSDPPHLQIDELDFQIQSYIMSTKNNYRLTILVSTRDSLRAIDPTFGLICLANNAFSKCACQSPTTNPPEGYICLCSLDGILSTWHSSIDESDEFTEPDEPPQNPIGASQLFMSVEKYNIVLALSPGGCVVMSARDCWTCALHCLATNKEVFQKRIIRRPIAATSIQRR